MKLIPLSQGLFAQVDDEDYEELSKYLWCVVKGRKTCYAQRGPTKTEQLNGKTSPIKMHRAILAQNNPSSIVDHIDRNGLNNQRSNLRIATISQNSHNRTKNKNTTSLYYGVSSYTKRTKGKKADGSPIIYINSYWLFQLTHKKIRYCGLFRNEKDAAIAYDKKAKELFGEFARLNFPESNPTQAATQLSMALPNKKSSCNTWKDIPNWEGYYQASIYGEIKSLERTVPYYKKGKCLYRRVCETILKPYTDKINRKAVVLVKPNFRKGMQVHRLVALAFLTNPESKPEVNHKNANPSDNRVENLEWVTQEENISHAIENNKIGRSGLNHPRAKFTQEDIELIREMALVNKFSQTEIARQYNVHQSTIWKIISNKTFVRP